MKPYFCIFITLQILFSQRTAATNSTSLSVIAKPRVSQWKIKNDVLILSWTYPLNYQKPLGYYIHIQEVSNNRQPLGVPKFVHVTPTWLQIAKLRGLKPHTNYLIKVVAYANQHSKFSDPVYVNTRNLEFLKVYNLTATNIKDTEAKFTWYHRGNNVGDVDFKLSCSGVLKYMESNGRVNKKRVYFNNLIKSRSQSIETYTATKLQPNTLYTCNLLTVAGTLGSSDRHSQVQFVTSFGKLSPPPMPRVITSTNAKFTVKLYPSSGKFGSVSHYVVYAVPVSHSFPSAPFTPSVPYERLISKAVSLHTATSASEKVPFVVGRFHDKLLPNNMTFDDSFADKKAFKSNTFYAFIVAAFGQSKENHRFQFSLSLASDPPVYIGIDSGNFWINKNKSTIKRFILTAVYTIVVVVVMLFIFTLVLMCLVYINQRNHKQIRLTKKVPMSEVETNLFTKPISKNKHKNKSGRKYSLLPATEPHEGRVDQIKRASIHDLEEHELKPELFSIVTPPESPRPTSPLVQSQRTSTDGSTLTTSSSPLLQNQTVLVRRETQSLDYGVGAGHKKDFLSLSFTLPHSRPYIPPESAIKSQYYYKNHTPGSSMPKMPDPQPPKPRKKREDTTTSSSTTTTTTTTSSDNDSDYGMTVQVNKMKQKDATSKDKEGNNAESKEADIVKESDTVVAPSKEPDTVISSSQSKECNVIHSTTSREEVYPNKDEDTFDKM